MSKARKKTILIIEDDKPINELMFDYLNDEGYETIQAFDAQQGLEILKGIKCDLITLDFNLPGIDGNQFLSLLPETASNIPIITVTANPAQFKPHPQVKAVIAKPFDLTELNATIAKLLA